MKLRVAAAVALVALAPRPSWSQDTDTEKKPEAQTVTRDEVVVVTASRSETSLVDARATISVVSAVPRRPQSRNRCQLTAESTISSRDE
jgi:outer membrane cobalamin receptor